MSEINDLEIVDDDNTARFSEGQAPSTVNNGARQLEGIVARWHKDTNASKSSTGSANAYAFAADQTLTAYYDGLEIAFDANFTNDGAATLDVDGVGAQAIVLVDGSALTGSEIVQGQKAIVIFDGSNWQLLNPSFSGLKALPVGSTIPYVGTVAPSGFVLAEGRTIGNAASGGTERAADDTENLFTLIWDSTTDANAPVTPGGRGTDAASDFAANKTITLPDLRGRSVIGQGTGPDTADGGGAGTARENYEKGGSETYTLTTGQLPSGLLVYDGSTELAGTDGTLINTAADSRTAAGNDDPIDQMHPWQALTNIISLGTGITNGVAAGSRDASNDTVIATGSVTARTLGTRAAEVTNVRDYGATGDGTTDDTAAIQAAIDATPNQGTTFFPSGTYKSTGLVLPTTGRGIRLQGSGSFTKLLLSGTGTLIENKAPQATDGIKHEINGFLLEAETLGSGTGIYIEDTGRHTHRNLEVRNFDKGVAVRAEDTLGDGYSEHHRWENMDLRANNTAFDFSVAAGVPAEQGSFATQYFQNVQIGLSGAASATPIGIALSSNGSLYRSFFGQVTIFLNKDNATGFFIDGEMKNAMGSVNFEQIGSFTGTKAWSFEPNADQLQADITSDFTGVLTPGFTAYSFDPLMTKPIVGWKSYARPDVVGSNIPGEFYAYNENASSETRLYSVIDSAGNTVRQSRITAAGRIQEQYDDSSSGPVEFFALGATDQLAAIRVLNVGRTINRSESNLTSGLLDVSTDGNTASHVRFSASVATNFDGMVDRAGGQEINITFLDGNTTLRQNVGANGFRLAGGVNYNPPAQTTMRFIKDGTANDWREMSRSENA